MSETLAPNPFWDKEPVNPIACEADVVIEFSGPYGETEIAGVGIDCGRCSLHQRLSSVGTQQEIRDGVDRDVAKVIGEHCKKLPHRGEIPQDLLPKARVL